MRCTCEKQTKEVKDQYKILIQFTDRQVAQIVKFA